MALASKTAAGCAGSARLAAPRVGTSVHVGVSRTTVASFASPSGVIGRAAALRQVRPLMLWVEQHAQPAAMMHGLLLAVGSHKRRGLLNGLR
jgi:hypothetical protein